MKINIHPQVLYRIPRFPLNATLADSWEELKNAIAVSSPEFYNLIKDTDNTELDSLPAATQYTIWKYFNRAKYRATPYASFAGVGLCEVKSGNQPSSLTIANEQHLHTYVDWPHKEDVKISAAIIAEQNLKLFANSSYYVIKDVIRYISFIDGQFQLSEIAYYETVIAILQSCAQPISYSQLIQTLNEKGQPLHDPIEFLDQLIELQLLITELHPNIIGQDYFQRIKQPAEDYKNPYILAERKLVSGALSENLFKDLHKLIPILQQLVPVSDKTPLHQLAGKLGQRFGTEEIPLLKALDPEAGVGYDDLAQAGEGEELVAKFAANRAKGDQNKNSSNTNSPLKKALLAQFAQDTSNAIPVLQLENIQMDKFVNTDPLPLPNTFNLLCSIADGLICIDSFGSPTANCLLGRFTQIGSAVTQTCRDLAELEQAANPEVLFFDIAYIAENKVDNVSRRAKIYPLQLSILNYDTSATPLTLDDITISVQGSNLFLWSKKHNKRLIPRLSSAYNYTRSDLALFRFFCDLQSQGLKAGLTAGLQKLLPDSPYYPRLQYRNLVLAPAKWKIDSKEIGTIPIATYLQQIGASRYFKAGSFDQTLCFDRQSEADMQAFSQYLKKHKSIYIDEAFIPKNSLIRDTNGQPYYAQLLMSLTHQDAIYKSGFHPQPETPDTNVQQIIPPGQDWLYWEIYCHSQRSDELLAGPVSQFLAQYQNHIHKWFFIRYNENGDHIRFRVQMKHTKDGYYLISALTDLLQDDIQAGTISELLLKTYKREFERYGSATMSAIESHFNMDSAYILSLIPEQLSHNDKYLLAANLALSVNEAKLFDEKDFLYIINKSSHFFNTEHHIETLDFKELNNAYKRYKAHSPAKLTLEQQHHYQYLKKSLIHNLGQVKTKKRRLLFSSLIHMHVNRLFSSNQRVHEMMIYYFLLKELQRAKATGPAAVMA